MMKCYFQTIRYKKHTYMNLIKNRYHLLKANLICKSLRNHLWFDIFDFFCRKYHLLVKNYQYSHLLELVAQLMLCYQYQFSHNSLMFLFLKKNHQNIQILILLQNLFIKFISRVCQSICFTCLNCKKNFFIRIFIIFIFNRNQTLDRFGT